MNVNLTFMWVGYINQVFGDGILMRLAKGLLRSALIVGINSVVGRALEKQLISSGFTVYSTTRRAKDVIPGKVFFLDLFDVDSFQFKIPVDVVYLCAALTSLSACKNNPDKSKSLNVDAPIGLARRLFSYYRSFVFLSTSAVFDGHSPYKSVTDKKSPQTCYGNHKAIAEDALLALSKKVAIVRVTKILTSEYPLIRRWVMDLSKGKDIEPFYDLSLCPIGIDTVAKCLQEVGEKALTGIIHLSGERDVTYQDLAHDIVAKMSLSASRVKSKSALESDACPEVVPEYTSLDMCDSKQQLSVEVESSKALLDRLYEDVR